MSRPCVGRSVPNKYGLTDQWRKNRKNGKVALTLGSTGLGKRWKERMVCFKYLVYSILSSQQATYTLHLNSPNDPIPDHPSVNRKRAIVDRPYDSERSSQIAISRYLSTTPNPTLERDKTLERRLSPSLCKHRTRTHESSI